VKPQAYPSVSLQSIEKSSGAKKSYYAIYSWLLLCSIVFKVYYERKREMTEPVQGLSSCLRLLVERAAEFSEGLLGLCLPVTSYQ